HTVHSLSIGFRRLDCSTGQYALFILFCKKGVDGFYPSTPNIIEPKNGSRHLPWAIFVGITNGLTRQKTTVR
ncbi:MAG TPA: hypothetical protein K8V89_09960, partial [Levilactobacillus brevis]|nr:hypothetical protein [Levilactobacillus brevis]